MHLLQSETARLESKNRTICATINEWFVLVNNCSWCANTLRTCLLCFQIRIVILFRYKWFVVGFQWKPTIAANQSNQIKSTYISKYVQQFVFRCWRCWFAYNWITRKNRDSGKCCVAFRLRLQLDSFWASRCVQFMRFTRYFVKLQYFAYFLSQKQWQNLMKKKLMTNWIGFPRELWPLQRKSQIRNCQKYRTSGNINNVLRIKIKAICFQNRRKRSNTWKLEIVKLHSLYHLCVIGMLPVDLVNAWAFLLNVENFKRFSMMA